MGAYFQAEKLKNRHTFLWGLTILMPLVCRLLSASLLIAILPWPAITGGI